MRSVLFVLLAISIECQEAPDRDLVRPHSARRLALVMGNDAYPNNRLHNAVNDARGLKVALEGAGFAVRLSLNTTQKQMETAIGEFSGSVRPGDVALFFYAGHGLQINDQNYLVPVDFEAHTEIDAKYKSYPAQRVQESLEAAGVRLQILVLDACRNNPFRGLRGADGGLAPMQAGKGTYIAFATAPGQTADDNPRGVNGLFTGEMIAVLREQGYSLDQLFNRVRERVAAKSHGRQVPWSTSSVTGEFYFKATLEVHGSIGGSDLGTEKELAFWNAIKDERQPELFEEYLKKYPAGEFTSIAKLKLHSLINIRPETDAHTPELPEKQSRVNPKDGQTYMWIPAGEFTMGCSEGDYACFDFEKPAHRVTITKGFWIGRTEVTQEAYALVTGKNPSHFRGPKLPVETVTWSDADAYCKKAGLRLPTEAEWEYAARGGNPSPQYAPLDAAAWFGANSGGVNHEVAQKQENDFGLYDMLGNVWEWVADWGISPYEAAPVKDPQGSPSGWVHGMRGCSKTCGPMFVPRVSFRLAQNPMLPGDDLGFRCAGDLPPVNK